VALADDLKRVEMTYFRDQIRNYENNKDYWPLIYYLDGFLAASISIFDIILAKANSELFMGLKDEDYWLPKHFEDIAKEIDNGTFVYPNATRTRDAENGPLDFYNWWDSEKTRINDTPNGKIFRKARNIGMHKNQAWEFTKNSSGKYEWWILDAPNQKISDLCTNYYQVLSQFVVDANHEISNHRSRIPNYNFLV